LCYDNFIKKILVIYKMQKITGTVTVTK
jgi:hypothetical protein